MATKTLLTSEDLRKLVADGSRYELSRGELVPMTPVHFQHGRIVIRFGGLLDQFVQRQQLGAVGTEIGFRLARNPDTLRAPDIAFVSQSRVPQGAAAFKFAELAPDLAVEVLSPDDSASEVLKKIEEYLAAGVRLVWIADPATQTVSVYRSLKDVQVLTSEQDLDGGDVLPGFRVRIRDLFAV
jgi:Uma2 family endonuclease